MAGLAGAYLANGRLALALKAFRRFVERWPDHQRAADVRKTIADLEPKLADIISEKGLVGEEGFEAAALHEEMQSLMAQDKPAEVRRVGERLLEIKPDFVPALNNISLACMVEGRMDEAIETARRALEIDPNNYHALSNTIRFLVMTGRKDQTAEIVARLKAAESDEADIWTKKIEAFSFLGDDQMVIDVFQEAQKIGALNEASQSALACHLAAAAFARTGKEREARKWWEQALEINPDFDMAEDNLDDLDEDVGEREGPWAFSLGYWLPRKTIADLISITGSKGGKGKNQSQRLLNAHPELAQLIPLLLERGDPQGREFAIVTAEMLGTPDLMAALRDFALSQSGSDQLRIKAAQAAMKAGLLPSGQTRMWMKGEWQDFFLLGIEIHGKQIYRLKPKAESLLVEAIRAMHEGDGERAETLLKKALEINPGKPGLLFNLAGAYALEGREAEARAMVEELHRRDPDYLFARARMSQYLVEDGHLDEAEEMLKPLLSRSEMHFAEFAAFCDAQINLCMAKKDRKVALQWLEMWEEIDEENPALHRWQQRLRKPKLWFR
jgi:tetratricopeptide (TPR) repeat protein